MSHVFHRHTRTNYPTAVEGDECYIIDSEGKRYLDACCGAAVSSLGHSNKAVVDALEAQAESLAFAHTSFFTTEPMEQLADFLVARAPEGIERAYFVSGGSEAVEAALKMARQYFLEIDKPQKSKVIARWQSYHGNTLGALSAGGNKWRRAQFEPLLIENMQHIPPCYEYRLRRDNETAEEYGERMADRLEEAIQHIGARSVAAFVAEPIVGATMGCVPPVPGYLKRVREICDKYEVLLILDEVMCGMGRTGTYYACEQEGITGDLITLAKGLGAGYASIGAVMVSGKIYDAFEQGTGFFQHGHTYMGHPLACAASLRAQQVIEEENLLENVQKQGKALEEALKATFSDHPHIGDIRGRGLFWGMEFVKDRDSKEPFDPEEKINAKIKADALENGLMCYTMGGTIDGRRGDHVMLAPPFIIDGSHIEIITEKLGQAIDNVIK